MQMTNRFHLRRIDFEFYLSFLDFEICNLILLCDLVFAICNFKRI